MQKRILFKTRKQACKLDHLMPSLEKVSAEKFNDVAAHEKSSSGPWKRYAKGRNQRWRNDGVEKQQVKIKIDDCSTYRMHANLLDGEPSARARYPHDSPAQHPLEALWLRHKSRYCPRPSPRNKKEKTTTTTTTCRKPRAQLKGLRV